MSSLLYARGAGLTGAGGDLAMGPGRTRGDYSAHFDKVTGISEAMGSDFYELAFPGYNKADLGRSTVTYSALLPHVALGEELADDAGFEDKLASVWGAHKPREAVLREPSDESKPLKIGGAVRFVHGRSFLVEKRKALWAFGS